MYKVAAGLLTLVVLARGSISEEKFVLLMNTVADKDAEANA